MQTKEERINELTGLSGEFKNDITQQTRTILLISTI